MTTTSGAPWEVGVTLFSWTKDILRAERDAEDILVDAASSVGAASIEFDPGQVWRSFPAPTPDEVEALRARLAAAGTPVGIVGLSIDEWADRRHRRDAEARLDFLTPQLETARLIGAAGVRLPIGQAGPELLRRLQPLLHSLDLVLYEEVQGQHTPRSAQVAPAVETIAELADPRIRILVDTSMFMPALPPTYLDSVERAGLPAELIARLRDDWLEPATLDAAVAHQRSGQVPPALMMQYMDILVRFGRSPVAELAETMPLVGAFHLKFWDLEDADGRVSRPIEDLGALLAATGFSGPIISEWGGHDWLLGDDAGATVRRHVDLARAALANGARKAASL